MWFNHIVISTGIYILISDKNTKEDKLKNKKLNILQFFV